MKKIYMVPRMEQEEMGELLPLCKSGVTGNDLVDDVLYGGIDEEGELDPS